MPLRPMFSAREQDFDVEEDTLRYGVGGKMQDYSEYRPINMEPQGIPESLRGRSYLRPLLQARGDGGGPLSSADMEANQNAVNSLDDYFTNRPLMSERAQALAQADISRAEAETHDPLYMERGKAQIQFDQKDALQQLQEFRRQGVLRNYANQQRKVQDHYRVAADQARASGNTVEADRLEQEMDSELSNLDSMFGFMGNDQRNILVR